MARIAAIGLLLCLYTVGVEAQFLSPGDLAREHAQLGSDADCTQCHARGERVDAERCNTCHDDIAHQLRNREGLHGTRFAQDACEQCHVEHRGRSHTLIRWPGGAEASFTHDLTGFALGGRHAELTCDGCHTATNRRGARTFIGAPDRCIDCHADDDAHAGRFGAGCNDCHDDQRWQDAEIARGDHGKTRFALRGEHATVACEGCHGQPARYRGLAFDTCESCHADPHAGRLGAACASCHVEQDWATLTMARERHPGLAITAGHAGVACGACHDRGLLRPPTGDGRCATCHAPVHDAPFGDRCEDCHGGIRWLGLPERVGRWAHARTAFPLVGAHGPVACGACHPSDMTADERFRGLAFDRCDDCHEDPHGGRLARFGRGDCETCHAEQGFRPTLFSVEQHQDTAFALTGRHVAVPCGACHAETPPRLTWTRASTECGACHENPHGDRFADRMAESGCGGCHSAAGWDAPNIEHSTWPLTGAHTLVTCVACHMPTDADRKAGAGASYRGVPRDCDGCHEDAHLGQFRLSSPVRACAECHTTTEFGIDRFDHLASTGYALEGKHAALTCEPCHAEQSLGDGLTARRYRLGYRACADCHADPHSGGQR